MLLYNSHSPNCPSSPQEDPPHPTALPTTPLRGWRRPMMIKIFRLNCILANVDKRYQVKYKDYQVKYMSQQTWSRPAYCPPPRDSEDSSQLLTLKTGCCIRTKSWKKLNWLSKKLCVQSWQKTLVWGSEVLHKSIGRCSLEVGVPEIEENNLDCRQCRRCHDQRPQLRFITIAVIMHWVGGKSTPYSRDIIWTGKKNC